jgi:hypothetical protein
MPYYFTLNDSLKEINADNNLNISYLTDFGKINAPISLNFNSINDSTKLTRTFFGITPSFERISEDKRFVGEAGLKFNYSNDSSLKKSLSVYPFIKVSYLILDEYAVMARALLSGGLVQQNLKSLYRNNNWLGDFTPNTQNEKIQLAASIEAKPIKNLSTKIGLSYKAIDNFNYFVPNKNWDGYYTNSYLAEAVDVVNPSVELGYSTPKGLGFNLNLDYYSYAADSTVYYLPKLKTNVKVNTILDWNISAEYEFNKKIGVFLNGNNLISKKYMFFDGYPIQGLNILAGIKASF